MTQRWPLLPFLLALTGFSTGAAIAQTIPLSSHRAVYELSLAHSTGKSSIAAVRGRILYDFGGSACEGYTLTFRQVSELNNGEGTTNLSDLRSTTWEDGTGASYRFESQNLANARQIDAVDGTAERRSPDISVRLTKPAPKQFTLDPAVVFPTEHINRILAAAREGKSILELPVYDGSEKGEKVYNTLSVIGREIGPGERTPSDAAGQVAELGKLKRWPVTVSYFDRGKPPSGEQIPVYALSFELYENGISRALMLDYNDFALTGTLTQLDMRASKPCP